MYNPPSMNDLVAPDADAFNTCSSGKGWFNSCDGGGDDAIE